MSNMDNVVGGTKAEKLREINRLVKGQGLQWFGHTMRREKEDRIRAAIERRPIGSHGETWKVLVGRN